MKTHIITIGILISIISFYYGLWYSFEYYQEEALAILGVALLGFLAAIIYTGIHHNVKSYYETKKYKSNHESEH